MSNGTGTITALLTVRVLLLAIALTVTRAAVAEELRPVEAFEAELQKRLPELSVNVTEAIEFQEDASHAVSPGLPSAITSYSYVAASREFADVAILTPPLLVPLVRPVVVWMIVVEGVRYTAEAIKAVADAVDAVKMSFAPKIIDAGDTGRESTQLAYPEKFKINISFESPLNQGESESE